MRVLVDGWVWLDKDGLTAVQLSNLKRALTVQPRRTSEYADEEPPPILMWSTRGDRIGIPRSFYRMNMSRNHEEVLRVTDGAAMGEFGSLMRFDPPFDEQERAINRLLHYTETFEWGGWLLKAGCGFGKSLRNGSPVVTPSGEVAIESLSVGDAVLGTDGKTYHARGVYPQGERPLYRMTFTDGSQVDCDESHLWTFVEQRKKGFATTTKAVKELLGIPLRVKKCDCFRFMLPSVSIIGVPKNRFLCSIFRADSGHATCIEVDSPDSLFLTTNCVPTHNTNVALETARRIGNRTLILVHKDFFMRQWKERIEEFYPGAKIGEIRQDVCDYEGKDFVLGMMQSIARDVDGSKYPVDMYRSFGLIISDETHRVGAQTWAGLVPRFSARWRMGLTATPRRKDGAENVFFNHIGEILYDAKTKPLVPGVRRLFTEVTLRAKYMDRHRVEASQLMHSAVVSQLVGHALRNRQICEDVAKAVKIGRKVMVVSERLEHLDSMTKDLASILLRMDLDFEPLIDYYTGEWFVPGTTKKGKRKKRKRSEAELYRAETANVVFATKQMVEEGLDIPALDVLVLATPLSDVEQAVGRVRRHCKPSKSKCKHLCPWRAGKCEGKPHPIVLDVVDRQVEQCVRKYKKRASFYRSIGSI